MTVSESLFKRRKVNNERLLAFGFSKNQAGHSYAADLVDGQFTMTVTITQTGQIEAEVTENSSGENYVLHCVPSATGAFVGRVRQEYTRVLTQIAEACFEPDVFKSEEAKQVIRYVREKYQNELEFLWPRTPDNAIFRRKDTAKWYAALLTVHRKKLGLAGDDSLEILDVRMKPEDIERLVDGKKYFPGYHMNKKHWVTLCFDGSVPHEEICGRIDASFALATK